MFMSTLTDLNENKVCAAATNSSNSSQMELGFYFFALELLKRASKKVLKMDSNPRPFFNPIFIEQINGITTMPMNKACFFFRRCSCPMRLRAMAAMAQENCRNKAGRIEYGLYGHRRGGKLPLVGHQLETLPKLPQSHPEKRRMQPHEMLQSTS